VYRLPQFMFDAYGLCRLFTAYSLTADMVNVCHIPNAFWLELGPLFLLSENLLSLSKVIMKSKCFFFCFKV